MVEKITEKKLGDFQEFERWLDKKRLLDSEVLYRGMQKANGNSKAHYTDITTHFPLATIRMSPRS